MRLSGERRERRRGWRTRFRFSRLKRKEVFLCMARKNEVVWRSSLTKKSMIGSRARQLTFSKRTPARSTSHARGERRRTQQSSAAVRVHISLVSRRVASVAGAGAGAGDAVGGLPSATFVSLDLHVAVGRKISVVRADGARVRRRGAGGYERARGSRAAQPVRPEATRDPRVASGRSGSPDRPTRSRPWRCSLKPPNHDRSIVQSRERPDA